MIYKLLQNGSVFHWNIGSIPFDEGNSDYKQYLAWLAEGNTPEPADPTPVPPIIVSPRQIRQALTAAGLRAQVEAAVAAGDQDLKDWWEFATQFEEDHPMVVGMAQGLGVADLHGLFVAAKAL
jgi:hypothetical protein